MKLWILVPGRGSGETQTYEGAVCGKNILLNLLFYSLSLAVMHSQLFTRYIILVSGIMFMSHEVITNEFFVINVDVFVSILYGMLSLLSSYRCYCLSFLGKPLNNSINIS